MGLIISSFNDLAPNFDEEIKSFWDICETILEKECYLHYSTIVYWSLLENDHDNVFAISRLMRDV